jgi:ABC-type lipoprotein release transport system permease subunit
MPLIGVAAGSALGLGLVALIGPGLDLASFVGTTQPIALAVPWTLLVALGLGFAGVMLLVTLVAAMSARAVDPARALRLGET